MSLDTYANLQTEILTKLVRQNDTDAQVRVLTWISLAEDEMRMAFNRLKVRFGEIKDPAFAITAEYTPLPTGFYSFRTIKLNTSPVQVLDYVAPEVADRWDDNATPGQPQLRSIQGNQLRVFPPPDASYTATAFYYALTALSGSNTSNWLLAAHPKLYYKAALAEAYDYYEDDEGYQAASADRDRMLSAISTSDSSDQQGSGMRMRVNGATP